MHSIVIESACMHDGEDVLLCVFINCPESRLVCFGGCALFMTPVLVLPNPSCLLSPYYNHTLVGFREWCVPLCRVVYRVVLGGVPSTA